MPCGGPGGPRRSDGDGDGLGEDDVNDGSDGTAARVVSMCIVLLRQLALETLPFGLKGLGGAAAAGGVEPGAESAGDISMSIVLERRLRLFIDEPAKAGGVGPELESTGVASKIIALTVASMFIALLRRLALEKLPFPLEMLAGGGIGPEAGSAKDQSACMALLRRLALVGLALPMKWLGETGVWGVEGSASEYIAYSQVLAEREGHGQAAGIGEKHRAMHRARARSRRVLMLAA
jgi:hypothetical protein